jgi:hypothetical protein
MAPKATRAPAVMESTDKTHRKPAADLHAAKYLSASAFARHASLSRSTVWRMRREGKLRYVQISPRLIRIPLTELTRLGKLPVEKLVNVGKKKVQRVEEDEGEAAREGGEAQTG